MRLRGFWKRATPAADTRTGDTATQFERKIRAATLSLVAFYAVAWTTG
jgi:hypothetical protein